MAPYKFPVYQPYLGGNLKRYVNECIDSTWISSKGKFISSFESAFAMYTHSLYAASVCNGTAALHLALLALGIQPGDEVIVPSLTYVASANAIAYVGATPVLVDSLPDSWQMDPEAAADKITPCTKAILAVHLYGHACDMDSLVALCSKHRLFLIEDCAEAFGTTYRGRHVGTFGDVGTFSFFGNKTITTGEGGMVISQKEELHQRVQLFRGQGVSPTKCYWHDVIGYNYRMTNICAAMGLAQLEEADQILSEKRRIARIYEERLLGLPVDFHQTIGDVSHSYWMCSILVEDHSIRDELMRYLALQGIETRPFFYPLHRLPIYWEKEGKYPVAESLSSRGINLPSYPALTDDEVSQICNVVTDFYAKHSCSLRLRRA